MRGPADYRRKDDTLIDKWPVKITTRCIAKEMSVAGRIREVVFAVVFVHPGRLEETAVVITGFERVAVLINYD